MKLTKKSRLKRIWDAILNRPEYFALVIIQECTIEAEQNLYIPPFTQIIMLGNIIHGTFKEASDAEQKEKC